MQLCRNCFYDALEDEVHQTIVKNRLFTRGDRVAVAASGDPPIMHCLALFLFAVSGGLTPLCLKSCPVAIWLCGAKRKARPRHINF